MKPQLQKIQFGASVNLIIRALERDGAVVIEGLLNQNQLASLKADSNRELDKTKNCEGVFFGFSTKRVATMVAKSETCRELALNQDILGVMDHFFLKHCDQYKLNLSQLIAIGAGERKQVIHPDDPMFWYNHPHHEQAMINVMVALDDFTEENGATHVVPGSHVWPRDRHPEDEEIIQASMTAGSCLIYLGSTRHGGGANSTTQTRRGLVVSYCAGFLEASENHFLAIPMEEVRNYPTRLQQLVGYFVHKPNLNTVDGRDPLEFLMAGGKNEVLVSKGFKDHMPIHIEELLNREYHGEKIAIGKV